MPTDTPDFTALRHELATADDARGIRAFVVACGDELVFEHWRDDVRPGELQPLNSVTKSVVGLLVGAAIQDGAIAGIDAPLADFLPEVGRMLHAEGLRAIRLRHVLGMTAGFAWDERHPDPCVLEACSRFSDGADRLRDILSRELAHPPGAHFRYDSHAAHLVSLVLERATGMPLELYASGRLFAPLGITEFAWTTDEDDVPFAGRGLALDPRDLLRLGQVQRDGGRWHGEPIVDPGYVADSVRAHRARDWPAPDDDYGLMWWLEPGRDDDAACFAFGFGEQYLFVEPARGVAAAVACDPTRARKHVRERFARHVRAAFTPCRASGRDCSRASPAPA